MDPLSISASVIAVLQATNAIISICYNFKAVSGKVPWALSRVIDEVKDLRTILEALERLVDETATSPKNGGLQMLQLLTEPETGPLGSCLRELISLEKRIGSTVGDSGKVGQSGKVQLIQSVRWHFSDREAQESIQRLQQCKSTLGLALAADNA
jgi:hypothetical protein